MTSKEEMYTKTNGSKQESILATQLLEITWVEKFMQRKAKQNPALIYKQKGMRL